LDINTVSSMTRVLDEMMVMKRGITDNRMDSEKKGIENIATCFLTIILGVSAVKIQSEAVTSCFNAIMKALVQSGNFGLIRSKVIPVFKKNLLTSSESVVVPDLATYAILFKSVAQSLTDVMDTYRMFECQSDCGLIVADAMLFNNCLSAVVNRGVSDRGTLTLAYGIINDMLSTGVHPTNQTCSFLVSLLVKCAAVAPSADEKDSFFHECEQVLTVTMERDYDVVPELRLFVQAVTGAIMQRRMRWVNKLFTCMVDQHKRNKKEAKLKRMKEQMLDETDMWTMSMLPGDGLTSSDDEQTSYETITPETVNYLLKLSAKIDSSIEIFLMLVELVLLNKLGLRIEGVLRTLKPLSAKSREKLSELLKKYKYKLIDAQ